MSAHNRAILEAAEKVKKQKEDLQEKIAKHKGNKDKKKNKSKDENKTTDPVCLIGIGSEELELCNELDADYAASNNGIVLMIKDYFKKVTDPDSPEVIDLVSEDEEVNNDTRQLQDVMTQIQNVDIDLRGDGDDYDTSFNSKIKSYGNNNLDNSGTICDTDEEKMDNVLLIGKNVQSADAENVDGAVSKQTNTVGKKQKKKMQQKMSKKKKLSRLSFFLSRLSLTTFLPF